MSFIRSPFWRVSFVSALAFLSACTSCPTQRAIAVHHWTPQEEKQAAQEIKQLPDDSILPAFLEDYVRLRREVR